MQTNKTAASVADLNFPQFLVKAVQWRLCKKYTTFCRAFTGTHSVVPARCVLLRSILFYLFSTLFSTRRYSEHPQGVRLSADYIGNPVSSYPALHNKSKYARPAPFIFRAESQIVHCQSFRGCRSFFFFLLVFKMRMEEQLGTTRWLCKTLGPPSLSQQKTLQHNYFFVNPEQVAEA